MIEFNSYNNFYKVSESRGRTQWPVDPDTRRRIKYVIDGTSPSRRSHRLEDIVGLLIVLIAIAIGWCLFALAH